MKKIILIGILGITIALISCSGDKSKTSNPDKSVKSSTSTSTENKGTYKLKKSDTEVDEDQTEPMTPKQLDKAKKVIKKAGDVSNVDGKKLFKMNCTSCHGLKGNLKINGAKDLTKSKIDLENAVAQVYFGKGLMTSYSHVLSEEEIVAVAKYTETLRR